MKSANCTRSLGTQYQPLSKYMKKIFSGILAFLLCSTAAFAQDIITTRSGEDIKAKITEIGLNDIKYKRWESPDGPLIVIAKDKVLLIRYEDGTKDIFEAKEELTSEGGTGTGISGLAGKDLYRQGSTDAIRYYRGYKGASVGTLIGSLLGGPILGLIPAIACSATTPSYRNLDFPSEELMKKRDYLQGFTKQARHIKSNKVWINYGVGAAISVLLTLLLTSGK